jgi:hypothetical protein
MEITGAVNVGEKFPGPLPTDADQDAFIKDACTKMTDAYLAPVQLRKTTLTLIYSTIALPSWSAGSHQVSCSIGATLGNGGWSVLLNSAKGPLLINGQSPVPPPDIPEDRLELPPIPLPPSVDTSSQTSSQSQQRTQTQPTQPTQPNGNQHLPGQASTSPTTPAASPTSAVPPPPGAPPVDGAPPPPAGDVPPPAGDVPPPAGGSPAGAPPGPAPAIPPYAVAPPPGE